MKALLKYFVLAASLAFFPNVWAQDGVMFNGTEALCDGQFFDDGGMEGGPYTDADYTYTICSDNPGDVIQIEFVAFSLQTSPNSNNSDWFSIYDGDDTSAPSLGSYSGNDLQGLSVTGTTSNTSGCLTFVFNVNTGNSNTFPGWEGLISCTTPCDVPISTSEITNPIPPIDTLQSVGICQGSLVSFDGSGSFAAAGFNITEYSWSFDDGTIDNTTGASVSHAFDEPGEYVVTLTVFDDNGCNSLNLDPLQVLVSTTPIFNTDVLEEVCLGGEACADGVPIESVTWTALPPQVVAGETYLADGAGFSYSSALVFDFFDPDQTLESCDDLYGLFVNMEHSYMGDLHLEIECPDGTSVILMSYPNTGGGTYLGDALDDASTNQGVGWDYTWDPDATNGTWDENSGGVANLPAGTYEAEGDLCDLVGCPLNGEWTFSITDNLAIDNGYIFSWGIDFNPALFPGITTFTPIIGLASDSTWWEGPAGFTTISDDGNQACITPPDFGIYELTYFAMNDFGCQFDTTVTIESVPGPLIDAGPDLTFCNEPVLLTPDVSVDGDPADCVWTFEMLDNFGDGWNGSSVDVMVDGLLQANYTLAAGAQEEVTINISGGSPVQFIYQDQAFANEISMILTDDLGNELFSAGPGGFADGDVLWDGSCGGFGTYIYEWTPEEGLDDPSSPTPTATIGETTTYTVTVYPDGFLGCASTDDVTIQVDPLGDPGQSADYVFCFHEGIFDLIDLLGGDPVAGGTWTDGIGGIVANPTFDTYNDAPDLFTYTVMNGGCEASAQVTIDVIPQGDPICCEFTFSDLVVHPVCNGYFDGQYSISISESTEGGPWNVTLSDAGGEVGNVDSDGSTISFPDLPGGAYSVSLLDAGLCTVEFDVELVDPPVVLLETMPDTTICINGTVALSAWSPQDPNGNWDYLWDSGVGSGTLVFDTPTEASTYTVQAVNSVGCVSVQESINVGIYLPLTVTAMDDVDICVNDNVDLSILGASGGLAPYNYQWTYEGQIIGDDETMAYTPESDGTFCMTLTDACESPLAQDCLAVLIEEPINVMIDSDTTQGCFPADINLMVHPDIDPSLYSTAQWTLSDGWFELNAQEFEHTFDNPGFFNVNLVLTSGLGCVYSANYNNYITVYDNPTAGYIADPQPTQAPNTDINFWDWSSGNVVDWHWEFNPANLLGESFEQNPKFQFPQGQGGNYPVLLTVTDIHGCQDQVVRTIVIDDFFNIFVPNAFTPNQDGFNDYFGIEGTDIDPDRFHFMIFDRWGEQVFESFDPTSRWTGGFQGGDNYVADDVYMWRLVVYSLTNVERHEILGYVTVVR